MGGRRFSSRRVALSIASALWLVLVGLLTLTPATPVPGANGNLVPLTGTIATAQVGWERAVAQIGGNLALLVPVAVVLAGTRWAAPLPRLTAVLAVLSASIELAQQVLVVGRVGDIDDVVLNVVGGVAAVTLVRGPGARRGQAHRSRSRHDREAASGFPATSHGTRSGER